MKISKTFGISLKIAAQYFLGEKMVKALLLLFAVIILDLLMLYLSIRLNQWFGIAYSALQDLNHKEFIDSLWLWCIIVGFLIPTFMLRACVVILLQMRWRYSMTLHFIKLWSSKKTFYGLRLIQCHSENTEQKIEQDIQSFIELFTSLVFGFINSIASLMVFGFILWEKSADMAFSIFSMKIHGSMLWFALASAVISSIITRLLGQHLSTLLFKKELLNANLRYNMIKVSEYGEHIALFHTERFEVRKILHIMRMIVSNNTMLLKVRLMLGGFVSFYSNACSLAPIVICAPYYFSKMIKLGVMMEIARAFDKVNDAISWFINSYSDIAEFEAVTKRLNEFLKSVELWHDCYDTINIDHETDSIGWQDLTIYKPDGSLLITLQDKFEAIGMRYLVHGDSGVGKSTLFRVMAGIWPFFKGNIKAPKNIYIIPQNPYFPIDKLIDIIKHQASKNDALMINSLLKKLCMSHIDISRTENWANILSNGEKQRLALICAIMIQPKVLVIDEGVSALNKEIRHVFFELIEYHMQSSRIFLISHDDIPEAINWAELKLAK